MKVGDRVRYSRINRIIDNQRLGTIIDITARPGHALVQWDEGTSYPEYPLLENLELVTVKNIDINTPLETIGDDDFADEVTFITLTSPDNHIMVGKGTHWIIFDRDGKYVRSSAGQGKRLTLRNKVVESTVYVRVNATGSRPEASVHMLNPGGTAVAAIKLTLKDGIVVDAELARANVDKFTAKIGS